MTRDDAIPYVSYGVDDTLHPYDVEQITEEHMAIATLVGWQCGFEPMFVAVWPYIRGVELDYDEAESIAIDWLEERGWFGSDGPRDADYIL